MEEGSAQSEATAEGRRQRQRDWARHSHAEHSILKRRGRGVPRRQAECGIFVAKNHEIHKGGTLQGKTSSIGRAPV